MREYLSFELTATAIKAMAKFADENPQTYVPYLLCINTDEAGHFFLANTSSGAAISGELCDWEGS